MRIAGKNNIYVRTFDNGRKAEYVYLQKIGKSYTILNLKKPIYFIDDEEKREDLLLYNGKLFKLEEIKNE